VESNGFQTSAYADFAQIRILEYILILLDGVGETCGTHGGRERCLLGFWLGGPKARDHWEDLGVGGG
jgi:hypothetical protein